MLSLREVSFHYPKGPSVLDQLSLQVQPGEIVGFLGANGSGKTTTFLLCTGFLRPTAGSVSLAGCDPARSPDWKGRVGVVMSGAGHYGRLTVRRNLAFFAELYGARLDLDRHLERHGLNAYAGMPVARLSTGYRQRLTLARATVHSPELLLLDEPADGLDPAATDSLYEFLREFADGGGGVLMTSHRVEELQGLCHRVALLKDGKVRLEGRPADLAGEVEGGLRARLLEE